MKAVPLVSVIIPCYNGEKVMHRLLESLLSQTYKELEIILINDGSKDKSYKIWKIYETKFQAAGMKTKYVFQENQGLGSAINAGLKKMSGKYFCWPDIDDYLEDTSIEKRVEFLEEHMEFGSVSSDASMFKENDLSHPVGKVTDWLEDIEKEWQFRYMLIGKSIYCSGCHMLRTSYFLNVNPDRYIYPARRGQNNQLLLPIYYKYKHGYINEPLYNYIIYNKSMSTPDTTITKAMDREIEYMKLLKYTLTQIDLDNDTKEFCDIQLRKIEWDRFSKIFIQYGKPIQLIKLYIKLKIFLSNQRREIKGLIYSIKNMRKK